MFMSEGVNVWQQLLSLFSLGGGLEKVENASRGLITPSDYPQSESRAMQAFKLISPMQFGGWLFHHWLSAAATGTCWKLHSGKTSFCVHSQFRVWRQPPECVTTLRTSFLLRQCAQESSEKWTFPIQNTRTDGFKTFVFASFPNGAWMQTATCGKRMSHWKKLSKSII